MTWIDRLKGELTLTSPGGNVFTPLWIGNERIIARKLGVFDYPDFDGTLIQDLGISGTRYPLTLYFEGPDNDIEANRFFQACAERGLWTIDHPVRGILRLQLSTVTERIEPVKSGNMTVIETEWIESFELPVRVTASPPQLAAAINQQADALNETGSDQFDQNVVQNKAVETLAVKSTTTSVTDIVETRLKSLYETVPDVNAQVTAILRGIQDTISQSTIDVLSLAGQMQNLITLPVLATRDIGARLSAYGNLIADVIGLSPDAVTVQDRNIAAVQELTLTATIISLTQTIISGTLATRNQSVETAQGLSDSFLTITNSLDDIQGAFIGNSIDQQYFSQSASFADASVIIAAGIGYLFLSVFDLAVEKRITLDRARSPIEITISEYGTLGDDDINFERFLASNNLKNLESLILATGKEVVVYV